MYCIDILCLSLILCDMSWNNADIILIDNHTLVPIYSQAGQPQKAPISKLRQDRYLMRAITAWRAAMAFRRASR